MTATQRLTLIVAARVHDRAPLSIRIALGYVIDEHAYSARDHYLRGVAASLVCPSPMRGLRRRAEIC